MSPRLVDPPLLSEAEVPRGKTVTRLVNQAWIVGGQAAP